MIELWKGAATWFIWILFCLEHFSLTIGEERSEEINQRCSFPQQWQPKVKPTKMVNKTLSGISYAVFCFPGLNFYVAKANSLRPSRFVLAKPIVWNNRNLAAFSLSSFLSFLNKIKLMGYVYDNIVGGLKVILPIRELLSKFLLELNVKLFSDLILFNQPLTASRGMKISNVVSSCCAEIHSMKFRRIILQLWVQRQGRYALNNIKHFFYKNERLHVIN